MRPQRDVDGCILLRIRPRTNNTTAHTYAHVMIGMEPPTPVSLIGWLVGWLLLLLLLFELGRLQLPLFSDSTPMPTTSFQPASQPADQPTDRPTNQSTNLYCDAVLCRRVASEHSAQRLTG